MRVTTKGRYALRASLALAVLEKKGGPVSVSTLSDQENISSVFLEQIFFRLRKAGIVSSTRGPGGGFSFAIPLEKLTVRQLIDAAGENLEQSFCDKKLEECKKIGECMAHHVWHDAMNLVNDYFGSITIASILKKHWQVIPQV